MGLIFIFILFGTIGKVTTNYEYQYYPFLSDRKEMPNESTRLAYHEPGVLFKFTLKSFWKCDKPPTYGAATSGAALSWFFHTFQEFCLREKKTLSDQLIV